MPVPNHILSFSSDKDGNQLFVHADSAGLDHLIRSLTRIRQQLDNNLCDHDHLMTNEWGGSELTEKVLEPGAKTIHHVKIFGWTDEWAINHGLRSEKVG